MNYRNRAKTKKPALRQTRISASQQRAAGALTDQDRFERLPTHIQVFVDEYLVDLNAQAAADRTGITYIRAYEFLRRNDVQDAIKERRTQIDGDRALSGAKYVLNKLWDVATADPRDLVAIHNVPCRHCYGLNGLYQFTAGEMVRLVQAHEYGACGYPLESLWPRDGYVVAYYHSGARGLGFDPQGGKGYTTNREPNPNCGECHGRGLSVTQVADTRKLKNGTRSLYRGVVFNNNGRMEIKMADQDHAIQMLARHFGVAVERRIIEVPKINPSELSDEQLTQTITEIEQMVIEGEYRILNGEDKSGPQSEAPPPPPRSKPPRLTRPK